MKLKNIEGALPEEKFEMPGSGYYEKLGFNQCRSQMGEVEITLNREKLIEVIKTAWEAKDVADALLAREGEIIEVKK